MNSGMGSHNVANEFWTHIQGVHAQNTILLPHATGLVLVLGRCMQWTDRITVKALETGLT